MFISCKVSSLRDFAPSLKACAESVESKRKFLWTSASSTSRAALTFGVLRLICRSTRVLRRAAPGRLSIAGGHFVDEEERIVLPRGINFSGLSKVPTRPDGATHLGGPTFYEHRDVSFVGRPCALEELDGHLERLQTWGFNLLRLVITWEAVEHAGPGEYDQEYLDFLRRVCLRAGEMGFWIIIDPHQDCWSRWTGGDGAPGWTLEAIFSKRMRSSARNDVIKQ